MNLSAYDPAPEPSDQLNTAAELVENVWIDASTRYARSAIADGFYRIEDLYPRASVVPTEWACPVCTSIWKSAYGRGRSVCEACELDGVR